MPMKFSSHAPRLPAIRKLARPHRVAVVAPPNVVTFDLSVPCTVFSNRMQNDDGAPMYDLRVCGLTKSVLTTDGFSVAVEFSLAALRWADTVVLPGTVPFENTPHTKLINAIRSAHRRGARVVSICTGAFILAAAGLLDGRRASTHWAAAERLATLFPNVLVDASALYIDEGSVCTSAGVAAGIDLCLHLVRRDFGSARANAIARGMVTAPHRSGGQEQYAEHPLPAVDEGSLERTRQWMLAHLAKSQTIDGLAIRASMSRRTFARRFALETGTSPLRWLLNQRVLLARRLLETTDYPVQRVAVKSGFGSALSLRHHFRRATGTSPLTYRQTFRGAV